MGGDLVSLRRMLIDALEVKLFSYPLPHMGPFSLKDLVEMITAVMVLHKSLKPGRYKHCIQWDIIRSYSAAYGSICNAVVLGLG